ncbi:GntR family transcriptional regulator [Sanguibacter suaedae]|uniref:GntR family transcriptional regulator n=1 Tax=Sanguibacter suaedae TaxID=2795737 RepID=A0A934I4C8_9MICO|nr:GntR family transcriptional regulator [Sanguibacter suaedae]MBI9114001.1 GntR family transcriptional regulator [Sanguibacter suaedae]
MDPTQITVDPASDVPPYEQVRTRVVDLVASQELRVGDRLPPIRALASALGVAAGTVARAYRELEAAGVVETRGRAGTVVAGTAVTARARLEQAARAFADQVRDTGLPEEELVDAVRTALQA